MRKPNYTTQFERDVRLQQRRLKDNSLVQLSLRDRELVVVRVVQPALSLEALLAQVTENNRHAEVLTDPAVGDEAW